MIFSDENSGRMIMTPQYRYYIFWFVNLCKNSNAFSSVSFCRMVKLKALLWWKSEYKEKNTDRTNSYERYLYFPRHCFIIVGDLLSRLAHIQLSICLYIILLLLVFFATSIKIYFDQYWESRNLRNVHKVSCIVYHLLIFSNSITVLWSLQDWFSLNKHCFPYSKTKTN